MRHTVFAGFVLASAAVHAALLAGARIGSPPPVWNARPTLDVELIEAPARRVSSSKASDIAVTVPGKATEPTRTIAPRDVPPAGAAGDAVLQVPQLDETEVFFRHWELDRRAEPVVPLTFDYPDMPPGTSPVGIVSVELRIDAAGDVVGVEVLESKPSGVFDAAAKAAIAAAKFQPAERRGKKVKSLKLLEVVFQRDGRPDLQSHVIGAGAADRGSRVVGERRD